MNNINQQRLDYLDAVRAFALLAGIVFHASLSFMPVFIGWAVMDISTSNLVGGFILVSHSFRMPLFFLIAGFFSHMVLKKRGGVTYVKSRIFRIGMPFLIGWLILYPMITSGWIIGAQSLRGDVNIIEGLIAGLESLKNPAMGYFVGTHLWFLYYLMIITAIIVTTHAIVSKNEKLNVFLQHIGDNIMTWLCKSHFGIFVLSLITACSLWFMQNWGLDTPDKSLMPHVPVLIIYAGCFLLGWLMHRQRGLIDNFGKLSWLKACLCIVAIITSLMLVQYQMNPNDPSYLQYKAIFCFSYALMMWSIIMLVIGLFKKFFQKPSEVVRYVSDASYWMYLIHLPIVVWLQVTFAELPLHWSLKLGVICVLTVGISLLIYDAFIRSTFIGKQLSGKTKERVIFRSGQPEVQKQHG